MKHLILIASLVLVSNFAHAVKICGTYVLYAREASLAGYFIDDDTYTLDATGESAPREGSNCLCATGKTNNIRANGSIYKHFTEITAYSPCRFR